MSRQERMRAFVDAVSDMKREKPGDAIFYEMDCIDNKTSSLLTHVSIMMAILSIFYSQITKNPNIRLSIILELFLYLVVTLFCLRGIFIIRPTGTRDIEELIRIRIANLSGRLFAYRMSLFVTYAATVGFIGSLFVYLLHAYLPADLREVIRVFH